MAELDVGTLSLAKAYANTLEVQKIYFGNIELYSAKEKLAAPTLSLSGDTLTITDNSGIAEIIDLYADGVYKASISTVRTVNYTVEGNETSVGIAYKTPTMADFNVSTMFTPYSGTITGSFAIADASITVGGFRKYGWENDVPLNTLTYSINGGAEVDISYAKYSTPETISLNVGDTITFYGYGDD